MLVQTGVTGYFLYRDTIEAQALGRAPEPLPVFVLSSLGVLAAVALANGVADVLRSRKHRRTRTITTPDGTAARPRKSRKADA
jgi:hypothetical protein